MRKPTAMFTSLRMLMLLVDAGANTHKHNEVMRNEWK